MSLPPKPTNEIDQLRWAIQAVEAHSEQLGPDTVALLTAPARYELTQLTQQQASHASHELMVVLLADLAGFTSLAEQMDAEDVSELMNDLWDQLDTTIINHHGHIDKHIGDAVLAIWPVSAPQATQHAWQTAQTMHHILATFRAQRQLELDIRIGIDTGLVILNQVGATQEQMALGPAVALATFLERHAPTGGVLVSNTTYHNLNQPPALPQTFIYHDEPITAYLLETHPQTDLNNHE
ncbi:MAG TPA: adenylate/guanylate cyclase domain-containing protein [Anaerolineae bacterium]|nr:adenylate/guanylate cyclase domain-containing protein [Anaerolineae bacterium]